MMYSSGVRIRIGPGAAFAATFLASAGLALLVPAAKARADIHDSLVVHLRFDGDVQDYSGRGNNGTIVQPGANSPYVPGIIGLGGVVHSPKGERDVAATIEIQVVRGAQRDVAAGRLVGADIHTRRLIRLAFQQRLAQ